MKRISSKDCKGMFNNRFNSISLQKIGIELKHFAVGTAPEAPSYLVNQDELKKNLIDRFTRFFDPEDSQGMEIVFLKSNYGNGKSHFLRMIHSFFSEYDNVITKQISLKQDKINLKYKILDGIGQRAIREAAIYYCNRAQNETECNNEYGIIENLTESLEIERILAQLLYYAAGQDQTNFEKSIKAVSILKGTDSKEYIKDFGIKASQLNEEFYFNVIRIICDYLYSQNIYVIIVLDEYEHIFSWKSEADQRQIFSDIKYFTYKLETYKNLFLVFGQSESANSECEAKVDTAYASRKKPLELQINNISNEKEVLNLLDMIIERYDKYFDVSLYECREEIFKEVCNDSTLATNSNYRSYVHVIMKVLEEYRTSPKKNKKSKKVSAEETEEQRGSTGTPHNASEDLYDKWDRATSISKKTMLCEGVEYIIKKSNEIIVTKSRKDGIYISKDNSDLNIIKVYYIVLTVNPKSNDFAKKYSDLLKLVAQNNASEFILLYPYYSDRIPDEHVVYYDFEKVPSILKDIYASKEPIENSHECLGIFEKKD